VSAPVVLVPGGIGGTGGLSIDLRNLAHGLSQRGREVFVAGADSADPGLSTLGGVVLEPLRAFGPRTAATVFGVQLGVRRRIRSHPGAVVHAFGCMPSYLTLAALLGGRAERMPVVWTPMFHPLRSRVWDRRLAYRPMKVFDAVAPRMALLADAVGVATEAEAAVFDRAGARRVTLLPPVVEVAPVLAAADAGSFRGAVGVGDAPLIVVVASRDEPRKGLDFALASFLRLRGSMGDVRLAIVGLGDSSRPLPEGAFSLGRVDTATLEGALRAADVVFVPSLFEAFSRVVIEAWQQASAVVVSDGVALAPTVAAERAGRVVRYGDPAAAAAALGALLADRELAASCGRRGRALVEERYELGVLLDAVEAVYDELAPGAVAR
jgi:glycosyltransferase involved in cell wall biosynthesis